MVIGPESGPELREDPRGMGWSGTEAKEVELSKKAAVADAAVGSATKAVDSGVDVFADTDAPEIDRNIETPAADSSEWILEDAGPTRCDIRAGLGRT